MGVIFLGGSRRTTLIGFTLQLELNSLNVIETFSPSINITPAPSVSAMESNALNILLISMLISTRERRVDFFKLSYVFWLEFNPAIII